MKRQRSTDSIESGWDSNDGYMTADSSTGSGWVKTGSIAGSATGSRAGSFEVVAPPSQPPSQSKNEPTASASGTKTVPASGLGTVTKNLSRLKRIFKPQKPQAAADGTTTTGRNPKPDTASGHPSHDASHGHGHAGASHGGK